MDIVFVYWIFCVVGMIIYIYIYKLEFDFCENNWINGVYFNLNYRVKNKVFVLFYLYKELLCIMYIYF